MWVYWRSEPGLWTVGYYPPGSERPETDTDHASAEAAAERVAWLNGSGKPCPDPAAHGSFEDEL